MDLEGQIFIQVNTQSFHRFGRIHGNFCHSPTFIKTAQELHKLRLSNMKIQFIFCHPRRYMLNFILNVHVGFFGRLYTQLASFAYMNGTMSSQELGKLLMYIGKNCSPRTILCGTPHSIIETRPELT